MQNYDQLKNEILEKINNASNLDDLEKVRVASIGKKGKLSVLMKQLGSLEPIKRKETGQKLNLILKDILASIENKRNVLGKQQLDARLENEKIDISLPVRPEETGRIHPLSRTMDEVISIFSQMGFTVAEGPDIETDYYNFTALNIPKEHPARQEHDTFYFHPDENGDRKVLRTHTSPVQIRTMENTTPPIRVIVPGRTYRSDHDATHSPMFHQCEGLVIGDNLNMGHLKGCLIDFCRVFFGVEDLPVRFRPSYFPFTEPSAEVDIGCSRKGGELKIGTGEDWLEILGSGMVNPRVLQNCGINPDQYQGFAFGMGLERIAMLKYGIPDLRPFFESDLRWMKHYGFMPFDVTSIHYGAN
jgi:phenylalanyl-tRNA synthetase alpha chain